jgi:hypothetical protein
MAILNGAAVVPILRTSIRSTGTLRKHIASMIAASTGLFAHTPPSTKLDPSCVGKEEAAKYVGAAEVANATSTARELMSYRAFI